MDCRQVDRIPEEFEKMVNSWLDSSGLSLTDFKSCHREKSQGSDGVYELPAACRGGGYSPFACNQIVAFF